MFGEYKEETIADAIRHFLRAVYTVVIGLFCMAAVIILELLPFIIAALIAIGLYRLLF